jgi:hypothetical protein
MSRNLTPRPVKATGAKDAHGSILDPASGALYVHMHRESGLAHRHYVLRPWQVRGLAIALSRPMLMLYVVALVTIGWTWSQAMRVPMLQDRIGVLTREATQIDTLSARLTELQLAYDQVQRMLGATRATPATDTARAASRAAPAQPARSPSTSRDSAQKSANPLVR